MVLLISFVSFAQFTSITTRAEESQLLLHWTGSLDSAGGTTDSLRTPLFELADYDRSLIVFCYEYTFTSSPDTIPNACVNLFGSNDNSTWTLMEQLVDTTTSETATTGTTSFSNKRYRYYKIDFEAVDYDDENADDFDFDFWFISPEKDPALKP